MSEKVLKPGTLRPEIAVVLGTRPGIVMFAPVIHALRRRGAEHFVIHTGQHYSPNMDLQFFEDLELPPPDFRLEGIAEKLTHGSQTAAMLEGVERILMQRRPQMVLVGGDANTNLAGALAARKLGIRVGHVEAGERSYDWRMPEEHNRRMIDHISDYLFITSPKSRAHLDREAVQGQIVETGNPIVDASIQHLAIAMRRFGDSVARQFSPGSYAIMTAHREENVDYPERLRGMLSGAEKVAKNLGIRVVFPAHPRTQKRLEEFGLAGWARGLAGMEVREGAGYLEFLAFLASARLVMTDSGGVQQEACIHRIPCITMRENTEWVETLEIGANRLVGTDPEKIASGAVEALQTKVDWRIPFGDGHAADHIVDFVISKVDL